MGAEEQLNATQRAEGENEKSPNSRNLSGITFF